MQVLILAGGYGTRLAAVVKDTPKALIDINGQPLLNYVVDLIGDVEGLSEILVVTNDKFFGQFEAWKETLKHLRCPLTVINDGTKTNEERLGSIGDIDFVINQGFVKEDLLVVGGDNLFDFDIHKFLTFAQENNGHVSIGLYDIGNIQEATKYGVVAIDASGKVTSFEEKPEHPKSSFVSMCFYYLPRQSLGLVKQYLSESNKADRAGDYIRWLGQKGEVFGFKFSGKWYDIGSVESYREAQSKFKAKL